MKIISSVSLFVSLGAGAVPYVGAGDDTARPVWGDHYRTLKSERLWLRFEVSLEPMARKWFPLFDEHIAKLQTDLKIKLHRPMPAFLVSSGFGNAFVRYADVGANSYTLLSPRLTAAELGSSLFLYAGDDEGVFDTFAHEVMHYIEHDQRMPLSAKFFGDSAFRYPNATAWMAEGWAVAYESLEQPLKGRMKSSYYGALFESGVSVRDSKMPSGWDFSSKNMDWSFVGFHYVPGANFYYYLGEKFGRAKLNDFVLRQNNPSWTSAYTSAFGKSYDEIFWEFQRSVKNSVEERLKNFQFSGYPVFDGDLGFLGAIGRDADGNFLFEGFSLDQVPRMFRVDSSGKIIAIKDRFEWLAPFVNVTQNSIVEWSKPNKKGYTYYFGSQKALDKAEKEPGLYIYDVNNNTHERVRHLPLVRSAAVAEDGDTFFTFKQADPNGEDFLFEKRSLSGRFVVEALSTFKNFASVSQMRLLDDQKVVVFSGIRRGGTWGLYELSMSPGAAPKLLIDTRGQDLFALVHQKRLYFLSDLNGESFQVYRLVDGCVQQVSREPFFVRNFAFADNGKLWAVSRRGQKEILVQIEEPARGSCVSREFLAADMGATSRDLAPPTIVESVKESHWQGLIPVTRVLLPRYDSGLGYGAQLLLAGESPYKEWAWSALGDMDFEDSDAYRVGFGLSLYPGYSTTTYLSVETSPSAAGFWGSSSEYRFLNKSVGFSYQFYSHLFATRLLHSQDITKANHGTALALGLHHSFENLAGTYKSLNAQRGWQIETNVEHVPSTYQNGDSATVLDGFQKLYMPWLSAVFPAHSLSVSFGEIKSFGRPAILRGYGGEQNRSFYSQSSLEQLFGVQPYAISTAMVRGYSDVELYGTAAGTVYVNYGIPLNFLKYGMSTLLGRRWLNPETTALDLSFFYNMGHIVGMKSHGYSIDSYSLKSMGMQALWKLRASSDSDTNVSLEYVLAKELSLARRVQHTFNLISRIIF